ncbi:TIR domain-containing protein [Paraburkholderia bryophila]|uniref:TIR-like protein DUF1863 n=1 Tax=Paraburkholderia bryophila TaxID=420952 RepID=A0A329BIF4_9BURK|nr:TIR-like protein DUF1863 [Paraburkholderia bryophila]
MGYRNKTYVIFDGDNDMWAYAYMLGWKSNDKIDFDFHDAHGTNEINDTDSESTVKRKLKARLANTKQAIVLIGEKTKNLYRYVRWEIEVCKELGIPIVAVNLNNSRAMDSALCPPILKGMPAVHVAFKMKIIKHGLDKFCDNFGSYKNGSDYFYKDEVYTNLGI